jgi:hypothetical protein
MPELAGEILVDEQIFVACLQDVTSMWEQPAVDMIASIHCRQSL